MKKHNGFTLIELMVTLIIVGILLTVGVPSLKTFMQGNQLIATAEELRSAINLARSEAIKLNSRVSICESSNGTSCSATGDWSNGWIVFVDAFGTLTNTGAACAAANTNCLLRINEGFSDTQFQVQGLDVNSATINSITFTSRGLPKDVAGVAQPGIFSVCRLDGGGNTIESRAVILSLSGRVRTSLDAGVATCP